MYRVIDTIHFGDWVYAHPGVTVHKNGVMAVLDPGQINELPNVQGLSVTVHKPDGCVIQLVAADSEVHQSVVGIFFSGIPLNEVPLGSWLDW